MKIKQLAGLLLLAGILLSQESCKEENQIVPGKENDGGYIQYSTPFEEIPETGNIVMYEVNLRAFSTQGDLQGVVQRLDELRKLNINVIWLMPIHPIGEINTVNSPYSIKDHKQVSPEYGTLADLRLLTDEAHKRKMAVIMDWVANHTAWDNPWIENKDWYTQNSQGNIIHPPGTNWLDVADLNYDNQMMRAAMIDAMKYWILTANIDGYRCDYADGVPFDFWEQALDTLNSIPGRELIFLAEGSRSNHFKAGFDLTFGWGFYYQMMDTYEGQPANLLYDMHLQAYRSIPEGYHELRYTSNHDESAWGQTPMVAFNGENGALAASVVTFFMGGVPLLYTGQEVGRIENVPFFSNSPIDWNNNPGMLDTYQALTTAYVESVAARQGDLTDHSTQEVTCFIRGTENQNLLVIVNMRDRLSGFLLPGTLQNTDWTNALNGDPVTLEYTLQLDNYQYLLLKREL